MAKAIYQTVERVDRRVWDQLPRRLRRSREFDALALIRHDFEQRRSCITLGGKPIYRSGEKTLRNVCAKFGNSTRLKTAVTTRRKATIVNLRPRRLQKYFPTLRESPSRSRLLRLQLALLLPGKRFSHRRNFRELESLRRCGRFSRL